VRALWTSCGSARWMIGILIFIWFLFFLLLLLGLFGIFKG
jgi:hypothetical protein